MLQLEKQLENAKTRLKHGEEAAANKVGVGEGNSGGREAEGVTGNAEDGDVDGADGGVGGAVDVLLANIGNQVNDLEALCESSFVEVVDNIGWDCLSRQRTLWCVDYTCVVY